MRFEGLWMIKLSSLLARTTPTSVRPKASTIIFGTVRVNFFTMSSTRRFSESGAAGIGFLRPQPRSKSYSDRCHSQSILYRRTARVEPPAARCAHRCLACMPFDLYFPIKFTTDNRSVNLSEFCRSTPASPILLTLTVVRLVILRW